MDGHIVLGYILINPGTCIYVDNPIETEKRFSPGLENYCNINLKFKSSDAREYLEVALRIINVKWHSILW